MVARGQFYASSRSDTDGERLKNDSQHSREKILWANLVHSNWLHLNFLRHSNHLTRAWDFPFQVFFLFSLSQHLCILLARSSKNWRCSKVVLIRSCITCLHTIVCSLRNWLAFFFLLLSQLSTLSLIALCAVNTWTRWAVAQGPHKHRSPMLMYVLFLWEVVY